MDQNNNQNNFDNNIVNQNVNNKEQINISTSVYNNLSNTRIIPSLKKH